MKITDSFKSTMHVGRERGFAVVEALVIVVVVVLVGLAGFEVYRDAHKKASTSTTASTVITYHRTTTVPSDWKTYTNSKYKLSLAYPPGWTIDFTDLPSSSDKLADDAYPQVCYLPPNVTQTCGAVLQIVPTTPQKDVSSTFGTTKITKTDVTLDGHPGIEVTNLPSSYPPQKDYYIAANGYTYEMPTVYTTNEATNLLSAHDSLVLFESIKIQ